MRLMRMPCTAMPRRKRSARNSCPLSVRDPLQPPACRAQLAGDAADQARGLHRAGHSAGAGDELGPGKGGADVDRRQLPDGAAGAVQAANVETVDTDELSRPLSLHVPLRLRLTRRLVGGAVAGDEREPAGTRVEAMPTQAAPDPVRRDDDPAPLRAPQLGSDPARTKPRVGEREGDQPLLDHRWQLVWHLRAAPLARTQYLEPMPVDLPLPTVVGRAMDTEAATSRGDTNRTSEIEQLQPVAEENVILRHATRSFRLATKRA